MPDPYVPTPDDPVGGDPILFRPSTFNRHAKAVEMVEGANNALYPRSGRGRTTHPSSGIWGYLAAGHTIGGGSGLSLGSGQVVLCSRSGGALTADGDTVTVLNSGANITGPQCLELDWTDGQFAVCVCGGTSPECLFCRPCQLPTKDLTYAYSGESPLTPTPGSGPLTFDGTGEWTSGSFAGGFTVDLQCVDHVVTPQILLSGVSQCTFGDPSSHTCNPLVLNYDVPNPSAAYTAGFRTLVISDPGPATSCPEACLPCIGCPHVVCDDITGVTLLPGGTVTDDLGTHSLPDALAGLLSSPRTSFGAVAPSICFEYSTVQIQYSIEVACDITVPGDMIVNVHILSGYALQELHDVGSFPNLCSGDWFCGWAAGPSGTSTQRVVPTCSGGFLTGTVTFPGMAADECGPVPYVVTDVSFSIPYTIDPMCQSFLVVGCTGLGVPGATVSVYDHEGGTLLYSGTTNSGGGIPQAFFQNAPNPFWIEVTSPDPRLADSAASHTLACASAPFNETSIVLALAGDYVCTGFCVAPIAKTLHATHPTFGAITLVYDAAGSLGSGWYATTTYSYSACRCCPDKTVTITHYMNLSGSFTDNWKSH